MNSRTLKLQQLQEQHSTKTRRFESVVLGVDHTENTITFQDEGDWINDSSHRSEDYNEDYGSRNEIHGRDPKLGRKYCRRVVFFFVMVTFFTTVIYLSVNFAKSRNVDYSSPEYTIRINAGASEPYYDAENNYWLPDSEIGNHDDFVVSVADNSTSLVDDKCPISVEQSETEGEGIYCTERSFTEEGRYEIAVPKNNAGYQVDLYFAEFDFSEPNQRQFDVYIEDFLVVEDYDIYQEAGAKDVATRFTYIIDVEDGYLSVVFKSKVESAKVSGIVVQYSDTLGDRR
jgi:Malectin domain